MSSTSRSRNRQPLPAATRDRVLRRDQWTCQACGGTRCHNNNLEIDHIIGLAEGGTNNDANLQTLGAWPCHSEKTRAETARGRARKAQKRPAPPHPGFR